MTTAEGTSNAEVQSAITDLITGAVALGSDVIHSLIVIGRTVFGAIGQIEGSTRVTLGMLIALVVAWSIAARALSWGRKKAKRR